MLHHNGNPNSLYILLYSFATSLLLFAMVATASLTSSSTIAFALFFSDTTAAALPIKNGRALSMVSSSISSPRVSKSCSTGIVPLLVSSLISAARFSSQFLIYSLLRTRNGRPWTSISIQNGHLRGPTYGKDNSADIVIKPGCYDSLLVSLGGTSLFADNKPCSNPNSASTKSKSSSQRLAAEYTTCSDHLDWLAGHGALVALAKLRNSWNQD